jgi:hypothetical protein
MTTLNAGERLIFLHKDERNAMALFPEPPTDTLACLCPPVGLR